MDQAIAKAAEVAKKSERRKSPTEVPKEDDDKSGPRASGGRFGRGDKFATVGKQDGKKKLRKE